MSTVIETNLALLLPELFLFVWSLLLVAISFVVKSRNHQFSAIAALCGLLVSIVLVLLSDYGDIAGRVFINNSTALFFKLICAFAAAVSCLLMLSTASTQISQRASLIYPLLLASTGGMMLLAMAENLISVFVSLEMVTLPLMLMIIITLRKQDRPVAVKVMLTSIFSTLLILYGFSFLYGLSGSADLLQMKINIAVIHLTQRDIGVVILLCVLTLIAGFMMKMHLPPFHGWAKELYRKLPLPILAFLATAYITVILMSFSKVFVNGLFAFYGPEQLPNDWGRLVSLVAAGAIVTGTIKIIQLKEIRSMLFYLVIVQAGFVMTSIVSMNQLGPQAAGFHLVAFSLAMIGAVSVLYSLEKSRNFVNISELSGLYYSSKPLAFYLGLFFLSLGGLPLTVGFVAKFVIFEAAFSMAQTDFQYYWMYILAGIGLLCAAVLFFYFVSIVFSMFKGSSQEAVGIRLSPVFLIVLTLTAAATLFFGVLPDSLLDFSLEISRSFGFIIE